MLKVKSKPQILPSKGEDTIPFFLRRKSAVFKNWKAMKSNIEKNYQNALSRFNEKGPYYTSYPTLALWSNEFGSIEYTAALRDFLTGEGKDEPIHLYIHIPFCAKLCWYCMCNIKVTNNRAKIQEFVNYLLKEIDLFKAFFEKLGVVPNIKEIQLGGGTPSHLDNAQFESLMNSLSSMVNLKELDEFAMEIDPRTTTQDNLRFYAAHGVQRISFGVQDFDPEVQKAINRIQPPELITSLLTPQIRALFQGVNFDLLYGLPRQTLDTFRNTVELTKEISPDRVTLLKYAHVPELRKHMKLINIGELPADEELPEMFFDTVNSFVDGGYSWVGVDNFAKPTDSLAKANTNGSVFRTFNGFTPGRTRNLFGFGPTTTAAFGRYYAQNVYDHSEYFRAIDEGRFPTLRGYRMSDEDLLRREVIFSLLCNRECHLEETAERYGRKYSDVFSYEIEKLSNGYSDDGLVEIENGKLTVTPPGRFALRNLCYVFDALNRDKEYRIGGC